MNALSFTRCAGSAVALSLVTACGTPVAPAVADSSGAYVGTSEVPAMGADPQLRAMPGYPAIAPDATQQATSYEYIINNYYSYASIFDYPKGDGAIGYIDDVGGQGCTNVLYGYGSRIAWIVAAADDIVEYRVPAKPIKVLQDAIGSPSSCAMDTSGDLAVGILSGAHGGYVIVYAKAAGSGRQYATALTREYFDGYDPHGNLFADGFNTENKFALVELVKGGKAFVTIKTSNTVKFPGSVQWDGTYLTITDQDKGSIYRYTVAGTKATLHGTVQLVGTGDCAQTWNAGKLLYCADARNANGAVFRYPAGGSPIATFTGKFDLPLGTTAAKT